MLRASSLSALSLPATCFYVTIAPLDRLFTTLKSYSLRLWSPLESLKNPLICRYYFHRFLDAKWLPKRSQNHHKTEFKSRLESHSILISFWHPQWSPQTSKTAILLKQNKHFHKSTLCLLIIVLTPKSIPKHVQNHPKTTQKTIPKTHPKSTPKLIDFGLQMTSKMTTKILNKSTWGPPGATRDP